MKTLEMKAYAKINLSLDVLGKYDNGYHQVEMIMQQVSLYDRVTLKKIEEGLEIESSSPYVPDNHKNIAYQIAEEVMKRYQLDGLRIIIEKNIPVAAGLAGGSTDAAAVIQGMNRLYGLGMDPKLMKDIAVKFGADIPFCIDGGAAVARGIGDELEKIPSLQDVWFVLCKPPIGVSTAEVYGNLKINQIKRHPETSLLIEAMHRNDYYHVSKHMYNVLEEVTAIQHRAVGVVEARMRAYGAIGSMMSGSGPTVFGIFKNQKSAIQAEKNLKKYYREVFLVTTIDGGCHE